MALDIITWEKTTIFNKRIIFNKKNHFPVSVSFTNSITILNHDQKLPMVQILVLIKASPFR